MLHFTVKAKKLLKDSRLCVVSDLVCTEQEYNREYKANPESARRQGGRFYDKAEEIFNEVKAN